MTLRTITKLLLPALLGATLCATAANAQLLLLNVSGRATFSSFVGGSNHFVTNNGATNATSVITTGTPLAAPFSISYVPLTGPNSVNLNTGTLNTATFEFHSTTTPQNYFSSVAVKLDLDFDSDGVFDLTQNYTLNLSQYTASNGLTGVNYSIVPQNFVGSVMIDDLSYGYASVVSNNSGVLFDGSSTTAALQFQFLANPVSTVPEPSSYSLLGIAALGCLVVFHLRHRRPSLRLAD